MTSEADAERHKPAAESADLILLIDDLFSCLNYTAGRNILILLRSDIYVIIVAMSQIVANKQ